MNKDPHQKREQEKYDNPIASREFILQQMEEIGEPASFKRIAKELDLETQEGREALGFRMRAMVRDGQLVVDRRNVYAIANKLELIAGKISAHQDGFGFLLCDEERDDIFLTHRQMRAVFHGDRVLVRVRGRDRRGRDEGEIVEVLERSTSQLVGRVYFENKVALFEALNRRIDHEILIKGELKTLIEGQIAVANIVRHPTLHGLAEVEITQILGQHLTPELEVEVALRNNDIPYNFSDDVIAEVDAFPIEVALDQKSNRYDLTNKDFITIDGEDARDFDDAVYCEPRKGGGWRLFVAIADVANYVRSGTALDSEGYERGTSVYFPQYVVPMLPEKLSNGLCSLNPEVDRLVLVCEMTISEQGRIGSFQFYEGVIFSKGRMTYTEVAEQIESGKYPRHEENLSSLAAMTRVLTKNRAARGALEFDTTEVAFEFSTEGRVSGVRPVIRNIAHTLIEECMLCANVSAARFLGKCQIPALYRVHEKPEVEKVRYLREFLASFGVDLGGGDSPESADYLAAIKQLRARKNGQVLQVALLRSMQQAVYQPENRGHFGLAFSHYAHFTSPIRRYPDLLVHRAIKSMIHSDRACKEVVRFSVDKNSDFYPYTEETVVIQGEHLSFVERRAEDAVYEVLDWIKCDYISEHIGDEFEGIISAVTKFGFFVQLNDLFVEGLVHVSTLASDYYHYNQGEQILSGKRTGEVFGMGDVVKVQVARVDVDERRIDIELISHSPISRQSKTTKRRAGKDSSGKGGVKKGRARKSRSQHGRSKSRSRGKGRSR